jgi:flagellar biosynthetic protein FliR
MTFIGDLTAADLPLFLLALTRVSGMVFLAPVFGSPALPAKVKALLALLLAMIFFPMLRGPVPSWDLGGLLLAAGGELAVGMAIGFAASLLFAGVHLAGQIVDQELGLQGANLLDPSSEETVTIAGQFKMILATLVFLLINGHHFLIGAVGDSFRAVPPLAFSPSAGAALSLSDGLAGGLFRMAVQIAAPTLVTVFLVTVAIAFMARAVPEMNVFVMGFALRLAAGLAVLALGVGLFVSEFAERVVEHARAVTGVIGTLGP